MDKYKHNLSFRLEKRKKDGELIVVNVPILADITFGTTRFYYSTGFRVNADQWIDKANGIKVQRVDTKKNKQQASEINAKLGKIKIAVDKVFKRLEFEEVDPTVENVRARLKREMGEEKPERKNLVQFYEDYIIYKTQRDAKKWSKSTEKKHRTILNHLKEYKPGMYFQDVTKENLDGFVNFLVNKKHHTNAYISKNIRDLCCFLNWAFNSGFNTNTAYQKYNPNLDGLKANDKTNIIALSSEEFLRIYNLEIEKEYLKRVRNLFCFCCSTGMRYSDAQNLKWVDIRGDKIVFVAIKTRQELEVPLNEFSKEIISRCEPNRIVSEYVFPRISNQKYNDYLKELGKLAKLDDEISITHFCGSKRIDETFKKSELLTTHIARKTFVTLCLDKGMQPDMIRQFTGHRDARVMERYWKFNSQMKADAMQKFHFDNPLNETIFDHQITDDERQILCIPDKDDYIRIVKADSGLATLHLALLFHLRGDSVKSLEYVAKLPDQMKVQYIQTITTGLKNEQ